jgi:POT family proton-dependent oligopeptide transporter
VAAKVGRPGRKEPRVTPSDVVPPSTAEKTFLGHPRGLFLLFFVEMWERFSYYGMRALLVLYLIQQSTGENPGRGWSKAEASGLYGWYTGFAYLMPLFGGIIADRLIGTHRSMLVGALTIALGHVVLAISGMGDLAHNELGMTIFVTGLVLIVIGTGHFKPTVSVMVSQLYAQDDPRRDGAFTIFYMGINLGALIGMYLCGRLGEKVGWHWGFGCAAIGMLLGLALYLWGKPRLLAQIGDPPPHMDRNPAPLFFVNALVIALVIATLFHTGAFAWLGRTIDAAMGTGHTGVITTAVLTLVLLGWSVWFVRKQEPEYRGPTAAILICILFNAVFWLAFEQAGSSLTIFASEKTDRLIGSYEVAASEFGSLNPAMIILFGPLFGMLWVWLERHKMNPSQPMKIALALFMVGAGYVVMVIGSMQAVDGVKVSMMWLTLTYVLHTWGELCISPTGLAFVSKTAPLKYVSFLMGVYFLSTAIANKVGGMMAAQVEGIENGTTQLFWYSWFKLGGQADFFLLFVISSFGAGLLILLLTPLVKRLLVKDAA